MSPPHLFFSGLADVCEWYDDELQQYRICVNVTNPLWGPLFGYEGAFEVEWKHVHPTEIPGDVKPIREERRE